MTPEALMRCYLDEVVREGRLEVIEQLAHEDMVDEANEIFGGPPGRQGLIMHAKGFRRHVGNLEVEVKQVVGGENTVMGWWEFTGTLDGPWLGREPTGKPIKGTVFSFFSLSGGLISRYRLWLHAALPETVVFDSSLGTFP